jgi:DNA helicase IV
MRDIVATIQTDQFSLITREPAGVFVVRAGRHGKTAVRLTPCVVAPLHVTARARASGVSGVVGPNPVFMD